MTSPEKPADPAGGSAQREYERRRASERTRAQKRFGRRLGSVVAAFTEPDHTRAWAVGAEGDNEIHGFNAQTGAVVFSGTGTSISGLHHYQTILATSKRLYVGADGTVYALKF